MANTTRKGTKKKISWDMAAQLVEYATSVELNHSDVETNGRICNLIRTNKTKAKDLLGIVKKRMGNKKDSVVMLSLRLLERILVECPETVDYIESESWQNCFLELVVRKHLSIDTKLVLLALIRGLAETYPSHGLFVDTMDQMREHGIDFPQASNLKKEVKSSQITKTQFDMECKQIEQYCSILQETFDYLTLEEISEIHSNVVITETVAKLEHALPLLNTTISTKKMGENDLAYLIDLHDHVRDILSRHKELLEKTPFLFGDNKRLIENTQFMMEAKKLR